MSDSKRMAGSFPQQTQNTAAGILSDSLSDPNSTAAAAPLPHQALDTAAAAPSDTVSDSLSDRNAAMPLSSQQGPGTAARVPSDIKSETVSDRLSDRLSDRKPAAALSSQQASDAVAVAAAASAFGRKSQQPRHKRFNSDLGASRRLAPEPASPAGTPLTLNLTNKVLSSSVHLC